MLPTQHWQHMDLSDSSTDFKGLGPQLSPLPSSCRRPWWLGSALSSDYSPCSQSFPTGVSKIVTVDVKGNSPLWLKVKDLAEGMTYRFRIKAKTFTYGPEIEANITTGPGEGRRDATPPHVLSPPSRRGPRAPGPELKTVGMWEAQSLLF